MKDEEYGLNLSAIGIEMDDFTACRMSMYLCSTTAPETSVSAEM